LALFIQTLKYFYVAKCKCKHANQLVIEGKHARLLVTFSSYSGIASTIILCSEVCIYYKMLKMFELI